MDKKEEERNVLRARLRKEGGVSLPRLPPIPKPDINRDSYKGNYLLKHRLHTQKQNTMRGLLINKSISSYKTSQRKYELEYVPPPPQIASHIEASAARKARERYRYLRSCVEKVPIAPMEPHLLDMIMMLIPNQMKVNRDDYIEELQIEIMKDFKHSMKRSAVQHALVKPDVPGLEFDDNVPRPEPPEGLDYSTTWHGSYLENKEKIRENLHILHPLHTATLNVSYNILHDVLLVRGYEYRNLGAVEFEILRNRAILECEKTETKILSTWWQTVIGLFAAKKSLEVKKAHIQSFYTAVDTLMANQVKDLLTRSIHSWTSLFKDTNKEHLPLTKMELVLEDNVMQLYPPRSDLEELMVFVLHKIADSLQSVATVQSYLSGSNTADILATKIGDRKSVV